MAVGNTGLFNSTVTNTTFNFTGNNNEGTTGVLFYANTGSGLTVNYTGTVRGGSTTGRTLYINAASSTLNVIGDVYAKAADAIYMPGGSSTCNITGNVYGSDTNTGVYAVNAGTGSLTVSITGNEYSGVNASCVYAPIVNSSVTITGNVRNYGSSGTSSYMANICPTVNIKSTATLQFRTSDAGVKDFTTSGVDPTLTAATIWSYSTRVLTAATNVTSDGNTIDQTKIANLDDTITSRLAATAYTTPPTAQDVSNQVLSDIDTNPSSLATITRLHNVSTVDTTGQQIQSI